MKNLKKVYIAYKAYNATYKEWQYIGGGFYESTDAFHSMAKAKHPDGYKIVRMAG